MSQAPMAPYAPQTGSGPSGPRAGFGRRFVAYLIDGILIGVLAAIVLAATKSRALFYIVDIGVAVAYFGYFEGGPTGQTLGKRAVGIRVYDFAKGGPIGFGRGVLRYVGKLISAIPCLLGFFWMLWDKEKQTWHDKIATTVVVPVDTYPVKR